MLQLPFSNRPPKGPPLRLPADHPSVVKWRAEIDRLREGAAGEANGVVRRTVIDPLAHTGRFKPSRLKRCPRDRDWVLRTFQTAWTEAIEKRLGQLRRLNQRLARTCPDLPPFTEEQLRKPPESYP